ncbi:MAG: hypothetical protein ACK5LC_01970 [Coprobacillaceae bacterium]
MRFLIILFGGLLANGSDPDMPDWMNTKGPNSLLDDTGKFVDDATELKYQEYVKRNSNAGKNIRDRLNWKAASDHFAALKEQGRNFELEKLDEFKKVATEVQEQITIVTNDGTKIVVDAIGYDKSTGALVIQEYKSSATAPFTDNQIAGFPELTANGGVIVGAGKGDIFVGGFPIPPGTEITIIRPK